MSYDLGVWDDPDDETAGREAGFYEQVAEGRLDDRPGSDRLTAFLAELTARWPGDTDEQFEDSPWSSWPLTSDVSGPGTVLTMRWGAPEVRDIGNLAMQRGLVVYDPQANMALRGHRAAAPVSAPRWQRLAARLQVPLALVLGAALLALLNRCAS